MDRSIFLVILFILININSQTSGQPDTQLENFKPEKYILKIYTEFGSSTPHYLGNVEITVQCVESTSEIILNARDLEIYDPDIKVSRIIDGGNLLIPLPAAKQVYTREENDLLIIEMTENLEKGKQYLVFVSFRKDLSSDFQQTEVSWRKTKPTHEKYTISNIGKSKRSVFPCIDLENVKAQFKLSIAYRVSDFPQTEISISNMSLLDITKMSTDEDWNVDHYHLSPPILTNDLVIALVTYKVPTYTFTKTVSSVLYRIYNNGMESQIEYAADVAARCVEFYSQYFDSKYKYESVNIMALPDFDGQDLNNGLILLNEKSILYPNEFNETSKFDIVQKLCHMLSHQWLGPFTTLSTSDDTWMIEGLSIFLEVPCIHEILEKKTNIYSLIISAKRFMAEMKRGIEASNLIEDISSNSSNILSMEKAYCLISMIKFFLRDDPFNDSLKSYVEDYDGGRTDSTNIWKKFLDTTIKSKGRTSEKISEKILKSWISNKSNYPIITVTRKKGSNKVVVDQKPFKGSDITGSDTPSDECFLIPLTYRRQNASTDMVLNELLECKDKTYTIDSLEDDDWILFNLNIYVLSLTNYDMGNWKLIQKTLLNEKKYTEIVTMTRFRLIHDMFQLSRGGLLQYDLIFETLQYLKFERSHSIWILVQEELHRIRTNLLQTELYYLYENYIRDILTHVFEMLKFSKGKMPKENPEYSWNRIVLDLSCIHGVYDCEKLSSEIIQDIFETYTPSQLQKVPAAVRDLLLCHGTKNLGYNDWKSLQTYYSVTVNYPKMRKDILMALGCSKINENLEKYLSWGHEQPMSLGKDSIEVFRSLSTNELGYPIMKNYIFKHHEEIKMRKAEYDTPGVSEYLAILLDVTTTEENLEDVLEFIEREFKSDGLEKQLKKNIDQAKRNINWIKNNKDELARIF